MATIPIRIILHGLIALVPQNGPDGATMTALLVNTRHPPADMECHDEHFPRIKFPTTAQECTAVAQCELEDEGLCLCSLFRQEISILPQATRNPVVLQRTPPRSLPFDRASAGDFAYVANLSAMGYTLDPAFLPTDPAVAPPAALAARFRFPFDTAAACDLATRRDDGADYVHATNMRPLGREEERNETSQAVAQRVETTVAIDVNIAGGQRLKLRLNPFPGQAGSVHEFMLPVDLAEVEIELSNERSDERRTHFMVPDQICDDGIGRDFAFFYDLVQNKPAVWNDRPLPHIKYSVSKSFADLDMRTGGLCRRMKVTMSRPICPMASFN